jgi:Domain of unknown function (DUF222)/HNH endonuclease
LHLFGASGSVEHVFVSDQVSDPLDLIRQGLAALAAEDRSSWSAAARTDRLLELRAVSERLEAEVIRTVGAWDAVAAWAEETALGPVSWLAWKAAMPRSAAHKLLQTARLARDHDRTGGALAAGEITVPHVEALAVVAHRRDDLYAEHEATLVETAKTVEVVDFAQVTRKWAALADDELARTDAAFAFDRRGFTVSPTTGGSVVSGFLDPEASATVTDALSALQRPDGTGDTRSLAQRNADALVLMCQQSLGGKLPDSRPIAGVEVVVDYDTLAGNPLTDLDSLRCEIEGFGSIARITAERLVCDCALARIVVKGRSEIVDYGRRTRTIPRRFRRLIRLRDQHCQYPGCRAPAAWCDVHHLIHWLRGGETNLENCALLCRRHHVAVHEGGWKLARGPDGAMKLTFDPGNVVLAA